MRNPKQNLLELEEYLDLCDDMVHVLHKMRKVGQPLSMWIVKPIFKGIIQSFDFNSLDLDVGGLMSQESGQNNS